MPSQVISFLLPDLRGGGAERVMLDLAQEFSRLGHRVEFVLQQACGDFLSEAERDFRVIILHVPKVRKVLIPLARYIRNNKPDIMVANMWPLTTASVLARIGSLYHCKLLLVEHNTLSQQYATWGRMNALKMSLSMALTYPFADNVAAVSEGVAVDTARLARLPLKRVNVLYNPIPQRQPPSAEARMMVEKIWGCQSGQRILTVGSLKDQKNHALLLEAFSKLQRPEARLLILGQGDNEKPLCALAKELGVGNRVIFPGFHPDPSPFYSTADLFVLSSDYEGFGNVVVEALSFGLPVVSTDCPSGPREILENGRWGTLTPVGDANALAAAINESLSTSVDKEALRGRAADFSPEIAARKYIECLGIE